MVTDSSNLYPAVIAELCSEADHQLCVFHVIMDINKQILDAVRRMRTAMSRRAKAVPRGSGAARAARPRQQRPPCTDVREKANFVFKHRYLIVKRRENLSESEQDDLKRML